MITQDLSGVSALDLKLDLAKHKLKIGPGLAKPRVEVNTLKDMRKVLVQKDLLAPRVLGVTYKGLCNLKDENKISERNLRYDCRVIRSSRLGVEFMKTIGCLPRGGGVKLYEVLTGEAWYILQKHNNKDTRIIEEVILLKAKAQDKVVIPPGYGYVIINIGLKDLVICRWVSGELKCGDEPYEISQGAAYFVMEDNWGARFTVNPYYNAVPNMSIAHPAENLKGLRIKKGVPLYSLLYEGGKPLEFLNRPAQGDYSGVFIFE